MFIALAIPDHRRVGAEQSTTPSTGWSVDLEWAPLVAVVQGPRLPRVDLGDPAADGGGRRLYLAWRTRWEAFATWVAAMVLSQLLIGPVKNLYERPRPPLPLVETTGFSFPSGHAVATGAIAVGLAIVLVPAGLRRRTTELMAILVRHRHGDRAGSTCGRTGCPTPSPVR